MSEDRRIEHRRLTDAPSVRVLVLEDDPSLRAVLDKMLAGAGYIVATAKTVKEALEVEGDFDVLVLDRHLPNGDGLRARTRWPNSLCLVISGHERPDDLPANCGFIAKPFSMTTLVDWIARHWRDQA